MITDSLPALISYIDETECYRFVNQRYADWFGVSVEEILGKKVREIVGPRAYKEVKPHIEQVLSGQSLFFDSWLHYKRAGRRFVHVSYVPEIAVDGKVLGFYAMVSDLSEQKRSEELLKSSEDRMRLLTESFADYAIFSMDTEGRIESWNIGAQIIFGYREDEIIGTTEDVLFTPEDVIKGIPIQEMRNARKNGRAGDERWHMRKDGSRFFASGVMAPLYIGEVLSGYAKIATDLTERKRNAEALQRAHDEMEIKVLERTRELAEMNDVLISEITERETAERQKIDLLQQLVSTQEDERRRIARDLHDQLGQRLTALRLKIASLRVAIGTESADQLRTRAARLQTIAELLDSEVSFLAWELRPTALDELGLVEAISAFVREWSRHYEIPAEFHSSGVSHLRLHSDTDTHLYRIAQEALNNIVKHAHAKHVSVQLEGTSDTIRLIIEDDGVGILRDGDSRVQKNWKGLGLAGMKERASLIGGSFEIETADDQGTTIYVRVPVETQGNYEK
jgi:PAS domain S-box-containing protein